VRFADGMKRLTGERPRVRPTVHAAGSTAYSIFDNVLQSIEMRVQNQSFADS